MNYNYNKNHCNDCQLLRQVIPHNPMLPPFICGHTGKASFPDYEACQYFLEKPPSNGRGILIASIIGLIGSFASPHIALIWNIFTLIKANKNINLKYSPPARTISIISLVIGAIYLLVFIVLGVAGAFN